LLPLSFITDQRQQVGNSGDGGMHAAFEQKDRQLHDGPVVERSGGYCLISVLSATLLDGRIAPSCRPDHIRSKLKGAIMPYVTISTARGIMDAGQKRTLLERVTDLMVEIEGQGNPDFRKTVWVKIEEQEPAHWSIGGMIPDDTTIAQTFGAIGPDGRRLVNAKA
jgi:4-oxalocrotonate tautomerase